LAAAIPVGSASSQFTDLTMSFDGTQLLAADASTGTVYAVNPDDGTLLSSFAGRRRLRGRASEPGGGQ